MLSNTPEPLSMRMNALLSAKPVCKDTASYRSTPCYRSKAQTHETHSTEYCEKPPSQTTLQQPPDFNFPHAGQSAFSEQTRHCHPLPATVLSLSPVPPPILSHPFHPTQPNLRHLRPHNTAPHLLNPRPADLVPHLRELGLEEDTDGRGILAVSERMQDERFHGGVPAGGLLRGRGAVGGDAGWGGRHQ